MKYLLVLVALVTVGCGSSSPTAPAPVTPTPVTTPPVAKISPTLPLVLAGQSNAVFLKPFLESVYPLPVLADSVQSGLSISYWGTLTRPQVMFPFLADDLHRTTQAFVWWQGESDRGNPTYLTDLRELISRARAENGNANLLVVEVRVLDLPVNADVRAAQEEFVRSDPNAVLVSSDGFQLGTSDHLTDDGYRVVAGRILAALR